MAERVIGLYEIKEDKRDLLVLEIPKRRKTIGYTVLAILLLLLLFGGLFALISRLVIVAILLILAGLGIAYVILIKLFLGHNKIIIDGRKKRVIWTGGKRKDEYLDFSNIKEIEFLKRKAIISDAGTLIEREDIAYSASIIKQDGVRFSIDYSPYESSIKGLAERISDITGKELKYEDDISLRSRKDHLDNLHKIKRFQWYRKVTYICLLLAIFLILGAVPPALFLDSGLSKFLARIGIFFAFLTFLLSVLFLWRCPVCKTSWGLGLFKKIPSCPICGIQIDT